VILGCCQSIVNGYGHFVCWCGRLHASFEKGSYVRLPNWGQMPNSASQIGPAASCWFPVMMCIDIAPPPLPPDKGKGLTVSAGLARGGDSLVYRLSVHNASAAPVDGWMIQFNKNSFGITPASQAIPLGPIPAGATGAADVPLVTSQNLLSPAAASPALQVCSRSDRQTERQHCVASRNLALPAAVADHCSSGH
jgi:hypothetical protein